MIGKQSLIVYVSRKKHVYIFLDNYVLKDIPTVIIYVCYSLKMASTSHEMHYYVVIILT